jgi:hypothetical protein
MQEAAEILRAISRHQQQTSHFHAAAVPSAKISTF